MQAERREFRLMFSNVDAGANVERVLVISRDPLEALPHLVLRVLAFALLYEERLEMGSGVHSVDEPDLLATDLTGQMKTWIACGDFSAKLARRVLQHNRYTRVHIVFGSAARRDAFTAEVAEFGGDRRAWDRLVVWTIDEALVASLAQVSSQRLRQRWSLTVVGDHIYADADGVVCDGAVTRG